MKNLLEYLNWRNPKNYSTSDEEKYFLANIPLFPPYLNRYRNDSTFFNLLKSIIVLKGLENQKKIIGYLNNNKDNFNDEEFKNLLSSLPHACINNMNIYIPFYYPSVNYRLENNPTEFYSFPYSHFLKSADIAIINPFETYGYEIFKSFINLKCLNVNDQDCMAFYHEKMETIYIINDLGGLDMQIPLFDEKLKVKDMTNLTERLCVVSKDYLADNKDDFVSHLLSLGLISGSLHKELVHNLDKREKRKERRIKK